MDLLPLIPESLTHHEVAYSIRTNLQTELDGNIYCKDLAENYLQSVRVEEAEYLVENAKSVIDIYTKTDKDLRKTQLASVDIMIQQAKYLIEKEKINTCSILQEVIKLKRCDLFKKLEVEFVVDYNLIQSSDLLPDLVKRYLDYRDGNGVLCAACTSKIKTNIFKHQKKRKIKAGPEKQMVKKYKNSYEVIPSNVVFHNYKIGEIYQKIIKIINTSPTLQAIGLESFPKSSSFSIMFNNNNQRLAAGMCATATVTFKPKVYRTIRDIIRFKNQLGEFVDIQIFATRDAPKLISCVFKSNTNLVEHSEPYCRFEEKRREALNSTIDCGSCLVSQYVLISIILENRGMTSKFFFITEDDWFFKNIDDISSCMELFNADFWIYPIYFKIKKGEVVEISTIFQPTKPGLHVETLYLMCDNNTFQQIELVGDAIEFSKRLIEIKIPPANTEIINEEGCTIFLGHVYNKSIKNFTIIVRNKSALPLNCEWKFRNNKSDNVGDIEQDWITQKCYYANIAPYTTTEFDFDICLNSKTFGYHSIFFCFYILNIPLISLKENEDFIVIERENISGKALSKAVDVLCTEIEVCMSIENKEDTLKCLCEQTSTPPQHKSKMFFSCPFVNFGILPFGLQVRKELYIRNDSSKKLSWKILEVEYNIDVPPYMEIITKSHVLGCTHGVCNPGGFKKLFYEIPIRSPLSYVSMLILISMDTNFNTNIEDICIISYEVINFDIQIRTKHTFPIICPLEIVYKGIPTEIQFSIENHSPIIGYFKFLSPVGEDIDKIYVELNPSSSVIKPLETITITAKLLCTETGLLEDFYIPCFVGLGQKPLTIKVLCVVEGPLLTFHLPVNNYYFKQVIWPNMVKDVFDVDVCECKQCNEDAGYFPEFKFEPNLNFQPSSTDTQASNMPLFPETLKHHLLKNQCGEGMTDPSIKEASASSNTHFIETKLENILRKEFNDIFLHEDIIEVHAVPIFTPTQVSIFIENLTPMSIKCNIDANNFTVKTNFDHVAVRLRLKTNEDIWNDLMGTEYGIVVQPGIDQKVIEGHSSVKVDFWIYANTFGIYTEEIVIEIAEIPSYYFSFLIEVIGCPIQLPFALNSITTTPTIRFGTIPVNSPEIKRKIKITNVSSIPVNVLWQLDENFGETTEKFIYVESEETYLKQHSSTYLDIIIKPLCSHNMNVTKNVLIGHIHVNLDNMKKSKYYLRKIYPNTNIIQLNVVAGFEIPSLKFDLLGKKKITFDIYANDVLLGKQYGNKEYVVLINTSAVAYETVLTVEYPFYFEACKDGPVQIRRVFLNPYGTSELTIHCLLDPDDLLCLSNLLYEEESDGTYIQEYNPKLVKFFGKYTTDIKKKIIYIAKEITAVQLDNIIQLPINLDFYYPLISVKPSTVKFGNVLVNQTYKDMITVFNHTGSIVKFEISKSSEADCFFITPHYGELPPNTGTQKQSVNIFIYFCANECKKYSGSMKVVTNIPNYFTEVYLKGTGTINEKFTTNYKI